jgi:uncharacterized membrane protein
MRSTFALVIVLALALLAPPATAPIAAAATTDATSIQARIGSRGFGRPVYRSPARRYPRGYPYRRRGAGSGFFGNVLKGLGIAYLVHMLFGWGGGGGSPFGLLLFVALLAWLFTRRRRRARYGY